MNQRILILTEDDDMEFSRLPLAEFEHVLLAFWCSPEFAIKLTVAGAQSCIRLYDIVTDYVALVERSYALARYCVATAPLYRQVNLLQAVEEQIAGVFLRVLVAERIHTLLSQLFSGAPEICFLSNGQMYWAVALLGNDQVRLLSSTREASQSNWMRRMRIFGRLIQEARQDSDWSNLFWEPLETLDPNFVWRQHLWQQAKVATGGGWFYSAYVNFSRILARHAKFLESKPRWVISTHLAQRGLPDDAEWFHLWQFGGSCKSHSEYMNLLTKVLFNIEEETEGIPLRKILRESSEVAYQLQRVIPLLAATVDLQIAFLERVQPQQLMVGNQWGSEGTLVQLARDYKIPIVQVQHGAFGTDYRFTPIYSDKFLVWGDFWKQMVNPSEQEKVSILNPGLEVLPADRHITGGKQRVTFFTTPLNVFPFCNLNVALWEAATVLDQLAHTGNALLVRVHPGDRIERYRQAWMRYYGGIPDTVRFSKGGSLDSVLCETDVAIMYISTIFLNCLASNIPVLSLAWYRGWLQPAIDGKNLIHFADSIKAVSDKVCEPLVSNNLVPSSGEFLATCPQ